MWWTLSASPAGGFAAVDGQSKIPLASIERGDAESGGGYRDRTGDPLLAKQVLSQLS